MQNIHAFQDKIKTWKQEEEEIEQLSRKCKIGRKIYEEIMPKIQKFKFPIEYQTKYIEFLMVKRGLCPCAKCQMVFDDENSNGKYMKDIDVAYDKIETKENCKGELNMKMVSRLKSYAVSVESVHILLAMRIRRLEGLGERN